MANHSPAPKPRRRIGRAILLGVLGLVALIVLVSALSGGGETAPAAQPAPAAEPAALPPVVNAPSPAPAPAPRQAPAAADEPEGTSYTYEVTGDGVSKASITYVKDSKMGQQQENSKSLPWSKTVAMDDGLFVPLSLVAQSGSGGNGEITCRIMRGDEELTSSTSSGPYAVVTCAGGA